MRKWDETNTLQRYTQEGSRAFCWRAVRWFGKWSSRICRVMLAKENCKWKGSVGHDGGGEGVINRGKTNESCSMYDLEFQREEAKQMDSHIMEWSEQREHAICIGLVSETGLNV